MPVHRGRVAALIAALALAAPASAVAQSAGDEQYQDPFAPDTGQSDDNGGGSSDPSGGGTPGSSGGGSPGSSGGGSPGSSGGGSSGSASGGDDSVSVQPAPQAPAANAAPAQGAEELPRTGADERLVALAGTVLLISGLALRRRTGSSVDRA